MTSSDHPLSREISAAFDWWREAGVELDFADDVTDWLAKSTPPELDESPRNIVRSPPPAEPETPKEKIDLFGSEPPQDLDSFREWWLAAPGLDAIGPRGRIPPRGPAGARLMFLVMDPEEADRERLLSGPQGRLVTRMLGAMGLNETDAYFASILPRHTPMADGAALVAAGLGEVLRRHVTLAKPERVLAFGTNILPLLEHDAAHDPQSLREINHEGQRTPLMLSEGLDSLLAMPRLKARFWHRWLDWTAN